MGNAIVLISGGLDSVTLAHYLEKEKHTKKMKLVFLDYGQKCLEEELFCVKKCAEELKSELKIIDVKWLGEVSNSLINKGACEEEIKNIKENNEITAWYVPCRNALFLLIGLSIAESEFISKGEIYDVYIGIKNEGELRFKDTTPEFLEQMNATLKFCTQGGNFQFKAPFLEKEKEDVIELAKNLQVNLEHTYSCYIGRGFENSDEKKITTHCGICGGCKARKKGFKFSEADDPSIYEN